MQIQLEGPQSEALRILLTKHYAEQVLLTKQSTGVYAAFASASYTIAADGTTTEEDFG